MAQQMNRRKAIGSLLLLAGAGTAAYGGIRLYRQRRPPRLELLQQHAGLIDALAETIIPQTDTPGSAAAGVGAFIKTMIADCTPLKEQHRFLDGLEDMAAYARSRYGRDFAQCSTGERNSIAAHFERRDRPLKGLAGKVQRRLLGEPFFVIMKRYTVIGYCTSMQGATYGLAYDYVPGRYACTPLAPGQKCWATW